MSVEIRDDNTSPRQWTKTVFIDGKQLRLQCPEDPIIKGKICVVRCITDRSLADPLNPDSVPYQAKPYTKSIEKTGVNREREVTTFYLQL